MPPSNRSDHSARPATSADDHRRRLWIAAESARNRIILRTVAGGARYAATLIDSMALPDVLGTIAGNDSVAIICTDEQAIPKVLIHIMDICGEAEGPSLTEGPC